MTNHHAPIAASRTSPQKLVIVLPVRLPTWNRLLDMHPLKRNKVCHLIHQLVSLSFRTGCGSAILTTSPQKPASMDSCIAEYYATIAPKKSRKSGTGKSKSRTVRKKRL